MENNSHRRLTQFPGVSTGGVSKKRGLDEVSQDERLSNIPRPSLQKVRLTPPALPLKVNPASSEFRGTGRYPKRVKVEVQKSTPWEKDFRPILSEDQAGYAVVAHRQSLNHPVVAIKEHPIEDLSSSPFLIECSHSNIVCFHEAYIDKNILFLSYEFMDVSLSHVQSAPCGKLASYQIAAIIKEVNNCLNA